MRRWLIAWAEGRRVRRAERLEEMARRAVAESPAADPRPPGWYRDPAMAGTQRYWDGTDWTDDVAPLPPATGSQVDTWQGIRIVAFGILAALAALWVLTRLWA